MKSTFSAKALVYKFLMLGGFHAFMFILTLEHPLVIVTCTLMTTGLVFKIKFNKNYMDLLFPLTSGLLFLPMKLFLYWDRADYLNRMSNLLLLALLFSLGLAIKKHHLFRKFLFYFNRLPLKKRLIRIFVFAEILFIIASFIMIEKGVLLGGDEPHYLVISHSIAKDGDLNVFNQYARDEYREFIDHRMNHHARVGKGFKVWYSYGHLPGLSLTTAPFFLFKLPNSLLYFLIRSYLGLFGALLAVLVYLFALKLWNHRSLAVFVTAAVTFTAPVFFYSIHIFAELQASLLVLSALYLLLYARSPLKWQTRTLLAGFLLGISVFWGLKYTVVIFLFSAGFFVYYVFKKQPKRALLLVLFPVLFQLFFFGYLYSAYGNLNPMSIYNGVMTPEQEKEYRSGIQQIPLQKRAETLLGIFFDQRDGLILYNPFYLLFFPGLIIALKKFRNYWPHLLISAAGFVFILFMGYSTVRPGYCPQARYLVPAVWALTLFSIIYYRETHNRLFRKIALYLPIYSVLVVAYQLFYPFTLYQSVTHINLNRPGLMFQQWSNLHVNLADLLPSFVKVPGNFKYLPNIIFLALVAAFILLALKKTKNLRLKFVPLLLFGVLCCVFVLFPKIPVHNPILLTKDGALPCKIYGESVYPTRAMEKKFELKGKGRYSFTLSTLKPAPCFVLEFENSGQNKYNVSINNFDKPVKAVEIQSTSERKVVVENPGYKRCKNSYFYRFHVELNPSPPGTPSLYLQVYPTAALLP
ncbi:MAG: hypothetical protein GY940_02850 [bacterium]|nr:hypothetical protein [bacterium]